MRIGGRMATGLGLIGKLAVAAGVLCLGSAAVAQTPIRVLSNADAKAYSAAFASIRSGDFDAASDIADKVDDECLVGRVMLQTLMSSSYTASYEELRGWLKLYHDQPGADRVYTLARKRRTLADIKRPDGDLPEPDSDQPDAAPAPSPAPSPALWARVEAASEKLDLKAPVSKVDPRLQAAKEAYYSGDVEEGYRLATVAGERWIAGLAAFRLKKYDVALTRLSALADDQTQNEWVRSAAAFWAARAAVASGAPEKAPGLLQIAARTPYTFYGLIAERQLGLEPAIGTGGFNMGPQDAPGADAASAPVLTTAGLTSLVRTDKRAHRAAAFAQIGLRSEAGVELRTALMGAGSSVERKKWMALGLALNAPLTSAADLSRGGRSRFDLAGFPTPEFEPVGGYTLDKALVYAIVRQESKFVPDAASNAGAYGLMQLTPATAARVAGDSKLASDPNPLRNPSYNLRIGQDYMATLLNNLQGDVLRAVAAYNAGPGTILKTSARMPEADSLLIFESMPGGQTREFVQKVVANYWIYRQLFGQDSPSLAAAASGVHSVVMDR